MPILVGGSTLIAASVMTCWPDARQPTMYTLDANILLRDLDTRSPQYAVCHALLERLQQRGTLLVEPLIVLGKRKL
jgi:hypothetical protein